MTDTKVPVAMENIYAQEQEGGNLIHFIVLRDETGRRIRIYIGPVEAMAVSVIMQGLTSDRPLTHDAMLTCLTLAGASVEEVSINDLREETFYALLKLKVSGQVHQVDVRPSDAVALALRAKCPLFISEEIIAASSESSAAA